MSEQIQAFEEILRDLGPASAYQHLTGRPDWANKLSMMIPEHMQRGWVRWAAYGPRSQPGGFIQSVVNDSLFDAFARADIVNAQRMEDTVRFLFNYAPAVMHDGENWKGLLSAHLDDD